MNVVRGLFNQQVDLRRTFRIATVVSERKKKHSAPRLMNRSRLVGLVSDA